MLAIAAASLMAGAAGASGAGLPANLTTDPGIQIAGFETSTDWTLTGAGAQSVNGTQFKEGAGSLQVTAGTGGDRVLLDKTVSLDMSSMARGGLVRFWAYLGSNWATTLAEIKVRFATATSDFENAFCYRLSDLSGMHQGWNLLSVGSAGFTSGAGVSWLQPIVKVRLELWPQSGKSATVGFDDLRFGVMASPAVVMSFDDGLQSVAATAYPVMSARGLTGTAYTISDWVDEEEFMTLAELKALYAAGWDIANHTLSHPDNLSLLSLTQIQQQLTGCFTYLRNNGLARASRDVAYPSGEFNGTVLQAMAAAGMRTGRMVSYRPVALPLDEPYLIAASTTDPYTLTVTQVKSRIDRAIGNGGVIHLFFHDVVARVTDRTYQISTADFTAICDYIVQKGIPSLTISQFRALSQLGPTADATPPTTTSDFDGLVHTDPVTIHLSATDPGSGVDYTEYSLDGGATWRTGTSVTISSQGVTTLSYRSADLAANLEQVRTVDVRIGVPSDSTPPVTTATGLQPSASAWTRSAVTVTLAATDAGGSGVAATSYRIDSGAATTYTAAFTISAAGRHTVTYYSVDKAGNVETAKTGYANIDMTAPAIAIQAPMSGGRYVRNQVLPAAWTATDALSGIASSSSTPVAAGAPLPTATFGGKTFSVTATDVADNMRTRSVSYSVPYASTGLTGVNADGSSVFTPGAVVPLRFSLTNSSGRPYTSTVAARLYLARLQPDGKWASEVAATAKPVVSGGNRFRSGGRGVYTFNLDTAKLGPGTWRLRVDLGSGGALPYAQFSLT